MERSGFRYTIEELTEKFQGQDIVIIGNGSTRSGYQITDADVNSRYLWTINNGYLAMPYTCLTWMMDDLAGPAWEAHLNKEQWMKAVRESSVPVMTSALHAGYPALVEYPLASVVEANRGLGYFAETLIYMLAWAKHIQVRSLEMHGCDFYPWDHRRQLECCMYWLGRLEEAGVEVRTNPDSLTYKLPALDGVNRHIDGFYGYVPERFPLTAQAKMPLDVKIGENRVPGSQELIAR